MIKVEVQRVKVGDILKFKKPIYGWHETILSRGGKYVVGHFHKYVFFRTADGETQIEELPEYGDLRLFLKITNGSFDCGYLSEFKNYEVIENVEE